MYRKILVIVLLLVVVTAGFAQRYRAVGGALNIYSTDAPFFLYINNVLYNNRASTDLHVANLTRPRYDLRIVFADRQRRTLNGSGVQLVNRNGQYMDVVFSVSSRRGNRGIILESMNPIGGYHKDDYREDLVYNNRDGYGNGQEDDDEYRQSGDREIYRNRGENNSGYSENENSAQFDSNEMNKTDSNRLNDLLNQKENDPDRLAIAAQELKNMRLRVSEIVDLMELFIRDDNKLTFAKYAYPTCVDKQNYEKVGDALSFSSTREKLMDFLKK